MTAIWIDAQLPPVLARWLGPKSQVPVIHVSDLGLLRAEDPEIFMAARAANSTVVTKDGDFVQLLEQRGSPPQVVWVTCGNIKNRDLRELVLGRWPSVIALLNAGETLVEIG